MKHVVLALSLVCAVLVPGSDALGQTRTDRITVPLSDANRPATLDIDIYAGVVTITAADTKEIVIEATEASFGRGRRAGAGRAGLAGGLGRRGRAPLADTTGLRKLDQPTSLTIEENNNTVAIDGPSNYRVNLAIQVPARTSLKLKKSAEGGPASPGTITVRGLDGAIEIDTNAGAITLADISGSVVAHSQSGSIVATVARVNPDRPMAFTSYSGSVDVTLPRSVKADFILRSGRRDVFTDFDLDVRSGGSTGSRQGDGSFRRGGNQEIRARANGGGPEFELRTYAGNVYLRRGN